MDSRRVIHIAAWTVNFILLAVTLSAFFLADVGVDWDIYTEAGRRFFDGNLYTWEGLPYRYSPLLAPLFLAPIGYIGWSLLHFAALLALPRRLALLVFISAPFWNDVYNGNTMTFVFVAAYHAMQGSKAGTWAFLVLAVLIPRPVMLPVLVWILWHRREWIEPFVYVALASIMGASLTGWLAPWVASELGNIGRDIYADIGPAMLIGAWWYPIGLGLAVWFTVKGHVGPASFLASGFWSLHYGIMLLLRPQEVVEEGVLVAPDSKVGRGQAQ